MTSEARGSRTGNTDFSIARILAADPASTTAAESPGRDSSRRRTEAAERRSGTSEKRDTPDGTRRDVAVAMRRPSGDGGEDATRRTDLTWLQYTRYRPPKLPRRSLAEKRVKRRAGEHPRIPFSSSQLQVLEDRYRRGAYLSRNDVIEISATLRLPQSKVRRLYEARLDPFRSFRRDNAIQRPFLSMWIIFNPGFNPLPSFSFLRIRKT